MNLRQEKGITLIALVITIIVMLILVGVTITIAVNGGLFDYAKDAATRTNAAKEYESGLANVEANLTTDELINYYSQGNTQTTGTTVTVYYGNNFSEHESVPITSSMTQAQAMEAVFNAATNGGLLPAGTTVKFYAGSEISAGLVFDNSGNDGALEWKYENNQWPANVYCFVEFPVVSGS